jgi:hypothetical protein
LPTLIRLLNLRRVIMNLDKLIASLLCFKDYYDLNCDTDVVYTPSNADRIDCAQAVPIRGMRVAVGKGGKIILNIWSKEEFNRD